MILAILAAELAESNALLAIAGAAATALTTLSGVLVSQMSGLRAELAALTKQLLESSQKHERELRELRESTTRADQDLAGRLDVLEEECGVVHERRKSSTTTGRSRPVTRPKNTR